MQVFPLALLIAALSQAPMAPPPQGGATAPGGPHVDLKALQTQVALDRAGFSPGVIDGQMGGNTKKALAQLQQAGRSLEQVPPTVRYRITAEDVAGPYEPVPSDIMEQSKLPALGYANITEALAERFHATPALLQRLNPSATFSADEEIEVPNVPAMVIPAPAPKIQAKKPAEQAAAEAATAKETAAQKAEVTVTVSKSASALTVTDAKGDVVMYAPVTTGSEHDPLPIGEWKVNGVQMNPSFRYNPELFWDADPAHTKAVIPPGPNNPVGVVWVDISKEHYGLHGTPEPAAIGRSESHGCVRLTNWDALRLAGLVKPGTRVEFKE